MPLVNMCISRGKSLGGGRAAVRRQVHVIFPIATRPARPIAAGFGACAAAGWHGGTAGVVPVETNAVS